MQSGMGADLITQGIKAGQDIANSGMAAYNTGQQQAITQEVARQKMEQYANDEKPILMEDFAKQIPEHLQFGMATLAQAHGIVEQQNGKTFIRTKNAKDFTKQFLENPMQQAAVHQSGLQIVTRQQAKLSKAMEPYKQKVEGTLKSYEDEARKLIEDHTLQRKAKKLGADPNFVNTTMRKAKENQLKYQVSPEGAADIKAYQELQQKSKQLDLTWNQEQETLGKIDTYRKKLNERFGNDIGGLVAAGRMTFNDAIYLEKKAEYDAKVKAYEDFNAAKIASAEKIAEIKRPIGKGASSDANTNTYKITLKDGSVVYGTKSGSSYIVDGKWIPQNLWTSAEIMAKASGKGKRGLMERVKLNADGQPVATTPVATPTATTGVSLYDKYAPKK
jgi:hypothetical protein